MRCQVCGFQDSGRSVPQNRKYWSEYIEPMAEAAGCTPMEMHISVRDEVLGRVICKSTTQGFVFEHIGGTTTNLTKKQFSDYLERVAQIAAETYGVIIQ